MRRLRDLLILAAAAAIGAWLGWILEPAINAWLFTRPNAAGADEPWDEPGGGW